MATGIEHNKRKNVGLIVEFVSHYVSRMLVEGNVEKANRAVGILRRHIRPGTELHKEFRLFSALSGARVSTESVASTILREARTAAGTHDAKQLSIEKAALLRELNQLGDSTIFETSINEYKTYATIQILLDAWRGGSINPVKIANFEDKIVKHLTSERGTISIDEHVNSDIDNLVVRLMTEKFNGKYGDLSKVQKQIINEYVTPTGTDRIRLIGLLEGVRSEALATIDGRLNDATFTEYVKQKMLNVKKMLIEEDISCPKDGTIVRFLSVSQLIDELKNKEVN